MAAMTPARPASTAFRWAAGRLAAVGNGAASPLSRLFFQ